MCSMWMTRAQSHTFFTNWRGKKTAEDAESDIAIRFLVENDYKEISTKPVSAKWKLKKNRPSSDLLHRANSTAGKFLTLWIFSQDHL